VGVGAAGSGVVLRFFNELCATMFPDFGRRQLNRNATGTPVSNFHGVASVQISLREMAGFRFGHVLKPGNHRLRRRMADYDIEFSRLEPS
jgi:hypothetical protein